MSETFNAPIFEVRQTQPGDGKWRRLLTHIEIRRVQNGFVVMGFNLAPSKFGDTATSAHKVCFVCETPQSLAALIESLTTDAGDFAWEPSVDLPITDLFMTRKIP
jgi:hypothetical protein